MVGGKKESGESVTDSRATYTACCVLGIESKAVSRMYHAISGSIEDFWNNGFNWMVITNNFR
jgi:hypothetical protein